MYRKRKNLFNLRKKSTALKNLALQPIAQRYICKMKYSQAVQLNINNNYLYQFNLNSLFDPDRTGTGHQPYGFDQLSNLYNRYRVIGCYYTVSAYAVGSPLRVVTLPSNDATAGWNNVSEVCENPRAKWKLQIPGGPAQIIKGYVSLPSLMGRNNQEYRADDRFQAQVTVSPSELAVLNIGAGTLSDSSFTADVVVTLHFVTEFFDLKLQTQS